MFGTNPYIDGYGYDYAVIFALAENLEQAKQLAIEKIDPSYKTRHLLGEPDAVIEGPYAESVLRKDD